MKKALSILLVILLSTISLGTIPGSALPSDYWPTDEWRSSTPEEQEMSSLILNQTIDYLDTDDTLLHSLLVIRNGYIVLEEYYASYHKDRRHIIF